MRVDGGRCGLARALVRSVLRPVDVFYWGIAAVVNGFSYGLPVLRFMEAALRQRLGDRAAGTLVAGSREPWLQGRRPRRWLLVASGLSFLIVVGFEMGYVQYVARNLAPGEEYAWQASMAHAVKDYARAVELCERAIEAGIPEDRLPASYLFLGNDYFLLGEMDKVIEAQKHAPELDPEFYPAWESLGTTYWSAGDLEEAKECYEQVIRLAPGQHQAHAYLGWIFLQEGQLEEALVSVDRALAVDPHSAMAHACLALARALEGRFEEARDSLQTAKENGFAKWEWLQEEIEGLEAERDKTGD